MLNVKYHLIYGFDFSKKENYPDTKFRITKDIINDLVRVNLIKSIDYDVDQYFIGESVCTFTDDVNPFTALNIFENSLSIENDIEIEKQLNDIISYLENDISEDFYRKDIMSAIKYFKAVKLLTPTKFSLFAYRW